MQPPTQSKKSQNSDHTQNIKPADTFPLTPEQNPDSLPGWEGPAPSPGLPLRLVWLFSSSSAMPQPPWPPLLFLRLAPVSRPSPESLPSWPYFLSPQIPFTVRFSAYTSPKNAPLAGLLAPPFSFFCSTRCDLVTHWCLLCPGCVSSPPLHGEPHEGWEGPHLWHMLGPWYLT